MIQRASKVVLLLSLFLGVFGVAGAFDLFGLLHKDDRGPYQPSQKFDPLATYFAMRWFPTHVDFGPDNDTLLVSLCHVWRADYCRIGKYRIAEKRWEILPFEEGYTYRYPTFSPDGQWIVYAGDACDKNKYCPRGGKLYRMRPDGSQRELLVGDGAAFNQAFSVDGRKLIYWKWTTPRPEGAGSIDLYQLELASGKETALTRIGFMGIPLGKVFFTPDGKRFVFNANVAIQWEGHISCTKPRRVPPTDPKERRKWDYGYLFGKDHRGAQLFTATMDQVPLTMENCPDWTILWPDYEEPLHIYAAYEAVAMDRQGRLLYAGDLRLKKLIGNPVALAIGKPDPTYVNRAPMDYREAYKRYPFAQLSDEQIRNGEGTLMDLKRALESDNYRKGDGVALFLRKPVVDAKDEAAFDTGGCSNSISPDGRQLAFIWGNCRLPSNRSGIALIPLNQRMSQVVLINWPRLELVPLSSSRP